MHWHFLLNVVVALLLGTAIGLERQWRQHQAGLRTNALVAVGAAMFVSLSHLMDVRIAPRESLRTSSAAWAFWGAASFCRDGLTVKGMNTAATIWCTGAIGTLRRRLSAGGDHRHGRDPDDSTCLRPMARWIDIRTKTAVDVEVDYRLRVECPKARPRTSATF